MMVYVLDFISELLGHYLPTWPVLVCIHYYLTAVALRNEPGGRELALRHPIASCILSIVIAGSGTIISSVMLGQPVLNTVLNERGILSGVLIWFMVHFSPYDVVYTVSHNIFIKLCLNVLEEIRRCRNILTGVVTASVVYPHSILPLALSGMIKGTGKKWSIKIHRLLTETVDTKPYELLKLSYCTKVSFVLGLIFAFMLKAEALDSNEMVLLGSCVLCSVKVYDVLFSAETDVFQSIQESIWSKLLKTAVQRSKGTPKDEKEDKKKDD